MSNQVADVQAEPKPYVSETEDLAKKLMHLPGICDYHVVMRQRKTKRFFCIMELKENGRRNRIVVPMCQCEAFLGQLYDVLKFGTSHPAKSKVTTTPKPKEVKDEYAYSTKHITPVGRRYYFDVIDADGALSLKLSYVYPKRRDSIKIELNSLVSFVDVIEGFNKVYPSVTGNDDTQDNSDKRFERSKNSPRGTFRGNRTYDNRNTSKPPGNRQPYVPRAKPDDSSPQARNQALKVCSDPAPVQFTDNIKTYKFEIVVGANTFMRITEIIGDSRKSTLHVPIDCLKQLQTVVGEMEHRFGAANPTVTSAVRS